MSDSQKTQQTQQTLSFWFTILATVGVLALLTLLGVTENTEVLEQIEEQQYALPYQNGKRKVHKIGVNISSASRTVDEWVVVD